jgi:cytochrome P450
MKAEGMRQSASLLTFVTYVLALHPDVYRRLHEEIIGIAGEDHLCTLEEIKEMRYCMDIFSIPQ